MNLFKMAERGGFEPPLGYNPTTALAKPPLQPLEYLSAWLTSGVSLSKKYSVVEIKLISILYFVFAY